MKKFVSDWHKTERDFFFPKGMPEVLQQRIIRWRRFLLATCYIHNGIGEEYLSPRMFQRISNEVVQLQAAWGWQFGFYDDLFAGWDETREDHLITNNGVDSGVINDALRRLALRKYNQRKAALESQQ